MNKQDDRNWCAYIDGELSVSEIEKFEEQLSKEELEHLNNERAFEEQISNTLKDAPKCPDSLCKNLKLQIDQSDKRSFFKYKIIAVAAIAACLALIFMLPKAGTSGSKVPMTIAELEQMSKTGNSLDDINNFLRDKSISLELTSMKGGHHTKEIIGAGVESVGGEEVVTLFFTCCGRPAKIYVLPRGSVAEKTIVNDDKEWKNSIQATAKKGNYRLAVSSRHNSESLLAYINRI